MRFQAPLTIGFAAVDRLFGSQWRTFSNPERIQEVYSTESALLKMYSDLCLALRKGHIAILGLLDLSAAFDTVDHGFY